MSLNSYYMFLHVLLSRFYSNNSSFIHGNADGRGEDQQAAVTGQVEIHRKILSLNFNNCHARICQVDSQSSVGGSVVVQVQNIGNLFAYDAIYTTLRVYSALSVAWIPRLAGSADWLILTESRQHQCHLIAEYEARWASDANVENVPNVL